MLKCNCWHFNVLINVKMPTTVGILTFMSRKNSILSLSEPEKSRVSWYFYTYVHLKFHAQLSLAWKNIYNPGAWSISCAILQLRTKQNCSRHTNNNIFPQIHLQKYLWTLHTAKRDVHLQSNLRLRIFNLLCSASAHALQLACRTNKKYSQLWISRTLISQNTLF